MDKGQHGKEPKRIDDEEPTMSCHQNPPLHSDAFRVSETDSQQIEKAALLYIGTTFAFSALTEV